MTRRERLKATLEGKPVARPPVSFHELDGLSQNPDNPTPSISSMIRAGGRSST